MIKELSMRYDPAQTEAKWAQFWATSPKMSARRSKDKRPYTIVIPPPNVTGILHMGHALNNTYQDILIRYKRMQGFSALWMPGTDHAGIATQNVVERSLAKEGLKRQDLGREAFLGRVWKWKEEHGSTIIRQLKTMGASCDWQRERFTMDERYSLAVAEVFIRLYEKDLIYRGDYIINWCPRCQTALADEEAPHHELDGKLYYIKYPVEAALEAGAKPNSKLAGRKKKNFDRELCDPDYIVVATTRPETMLGDTAVAVHPKDRRYRSLIGKSLTLPLMGRSIKIIADEMVDKKFGTGAVKVTPAHDPNDYQMGVKHSLDFINVMRPDGVLNSFAGPYEGMDRFEAREAIIEDLRNLKLLEKIDNHRHAVGHCYRCSTVIEPYLSKQWFVRMQPLSLSALRVVKEGQVKFYPKRWTKVYLNWMENIRDWCISRQIWWGHRLPVYYCQSCLTESEKMTSPFQEPSGKKRSVVQTSLQKKGIVVSVSKPQECPHCGNQDLQQDPDVLDTWFSSWLWPFATFDWPFQEQKTEDTDQKTEEKKRDLEFFYPTSALVTAPEIIFFWVARMIMAGCEFMGQAPFKDVFIHGTVRDEQGRKMSKSLGNSIDPLQIIAEYGADALRFSLMAATASGSDIYLSKEKFEQGRNFANKIWNASRYIVMNLHPEVEGRLPSKGELRIQDRWIIHELNEVTRKSRKALDSFNFNEYVNLLFTFFWHSFCDRYLEVIKADIGLRCVQEVLLFCLKRFLLLLHPVMPFISDEISTHLAGKKNESLCLEAWPQAEKEWEDKDCAQTLELMFACVSRLRELRQSAQVPLQDKLVAMISVDGPKRSALEPLFELIKVLSNLSQLRIGSGEFKEKGMLVAVIDKDVSVSLELSDADEASIGKKLNEEIILTGALINQKEKLVGNSGFKKNAPKEVFEKETQKLFELKEKLEQLRRLKNARFEA